MNKMYIYNEFYQFVEDGKDFNTKSMGPTEKVLSYFGINYPDFDNRSIRDYRFNNLKILKNFIIKDATKEQCDILLKVIAGGTDVLSSSSSN